MKLFLFAELFIFLVFISACREAGELNVRGFVISEAVMNAEIFILYMIYNMLYLPIK